MTRLCIGRLIQVARSRCARATRRAIRAGQAWLVLAALLAPVATGAGAAEFAAELRARVLLGQGASGADTSSDDFVVTNFYATRELRPLWVDGTGLTARGRSLAELIAQADLDGLDPADYDSVRINALLGASSPGDLAELELRLSLALVRLASDLDAGRIEPNRADPEVHVYPRRPHSGVLLQAAASASNMAEFLDRYRPRGEDYRRLKAALAAYRAMAEAGGWQPVPDGPTLRPGTIDPRIRAVRQRLIAGDEMAASEDRSAAGGNADLFDAALEAAIRRFQQRHGHDVDGAIGARAIVAFNLPVERRIEQIRVNLERRRWVADDLGDRYIVVNPPDFHLKLFKGGEVAFDTRVVVGTSVNRTPVFTASMTHITLNPNWNVPLDIARKEILPKVKQDPGYLAQHNYVLLGGSAGESSLIDPTQVDWTRLSTNYFPYRIRQQPGANNALGRIKFVLPNKFDVYLHDTPMRGLFARARRAFSHGCIRVKDPERLADVILEDQPNWTPANLRSSIDSGRTMGIAIARPIPVHITYVTAWVEADGVVQFRDDIYGRDKAVAAALAKPKKLLKSQ